MAKPGIEVEDLSAQVESIELTGDHPALRDLGWELVRPTEADSLDLLDDDLGVEADASADDDDEVLDLELFTETTTDLDARLRQSEDEQLQLAAELAGQRARAEQRIEALQEELEERGQLLAAREAEIEELAAQLASVTLERDGLEARLRESRSLQQPPRPDEAAGIPQAPPAAVQSLKDRLDERGRALAVARGEIDCLRADREQLVAGLAERGAFIQELHRRMRALEAAAHGGGDLRKLLARFLGGAREGQRSQRPTPPPPAPPAAEAAAIEQDAPIRQVSLRRYLVGLDTLAQVFELQGPRVSIGRTQENDITITDPAVSRLHAVINLRGRHATLVDANSKNGVTVNGQPVRHARLRDGDLVGLGTVRLRYRATSSLESDAGYGPA